MFFFAINCGILFSELNIWDLGKDEVIKEKEIHKLINYYINELKFRYVSKYKILKPHYERKCYTLVQEVESLQ